MGGGNPVKKTGNSIKKFTEDPGRMAAFVATGGFSEVGRSAIKELTPSMPDMPSMGASTDQPTANDAAEALSQDAALLEMEGRKTRGRASTILTGPQGLSGSTQYAARRTLLGV